MLSLFSSILVDVIKVINLYGLKYCQFIKNFYPDDKQYGSLNTKASELNLSNHFIRKHLFVPKGFLNASIPALVNFQIEMMISHMD